MSHNNINDNNDGEGFDYDKQEPANTKGVDSDTIYYIPAHDIVNIEELHRQEQRKRFRLVTKSGWYYNDEGKLVNMKEEEEERKKKKR
jgi:hypothetical protein